jgi:1-acyl-sn-glycerol-3-phosphate acyltransferase
MGGPGPWVERVTIFVVFHLVKLFLWLFTRIRVSGQENIPPGGGVLFLSNHISALDVFFIPWAIYTQFPQEVIRQVGKEELFHIPIVGWILSKIRGFPIKRGRADLGAIREIEKFIRNDKVVIYPEGTRSRDGKLGKGNRMVGRFIRSAKPTIIPVAIQGTDLLLPVGKTIPQRGVKIEIVFGAPLDLHEEFEIENIKESSVRIVDKVMGSISSLLDQMNSARPVSTHVVEEARG